MKIRKKSTEYKPTAQEIEAQNYAGKLVKVFITQNNAADACGISRGRMSHIVHGKFSDVSITNTDVKVMQAIYEYRIVRSHVSDEARKLMDKFEKELAESHRANQQTAATARQIVRLLKKGVA